MRVEIEVVPDGAAGAAEYWLYFAVSAAPSGAASARLSRSRSTRHALAEWSTPQGREWTFRVDRIRLRLDAMNPGMNDTTPQTALGKVLWHFTMSLDGFVAGPDHAMDWM